MPGTPKAGRTREAREVARLKKAQQVGLLLQGRSSKPLAPVTAEDLAAIPRRELREERGKLQLVAKEIRRFCEINFEGATIDRLAALHDDLVRRDSTIRMPLGEFIEKVGRPIGDALRSAPAHATVCLSPLGVQTEFPEMHHARDLACAFSNVLDSWKWHDDSRSWARLATESRTQAVRLRLSRYRFSMRMTMLVCFNLIEAYVNGVAFDHVQRGGLAGLSPKQANLLTECDRPVNLIDKIVKIPRIVGRLKENPLHDSRDPLKKFVEVVKPYRDSIVHASPFSAPLKFGGYDKLEKLQSLDGATVSEGVRTSLQIISVIHHALGGHGDHPRWIDELLSAEPIRKWFAESRLRG